MKKTLKALTLFSSLMISSCANPFNLKAIEKELNSISLFSGFRNAVIVSGASSSTVTTGGYKVTSSIGDVAKGSTVNTAAGYRVSNFVTSEK